LGEYVLGITPRWGWGWAIGEIGIGVGVGTIYI